MAAAVNTAVLASPEVMTRIFQGVLGNRRQSEKIIYYRKRNGWITWADLQPNKYILYTMMRGWLALPQYGYVSNDSLECANAQAKGVYCNPLWVGILNHPNGPGEFLEEQVKTYCWDEADSLPEGVRKDIIFPQLMGQEIVRYSCPQCTDTAFLEPTYLSRHLQIHHDWTMTRVLEYGASIGRDFLPALTKGTIRSHVYGSDREPTPEAPIVKRYVSQRVEAPIPPEWREGEMVMLDPMTDEPITQALETPMSLSEQIAAAEALLIQLRLVEQQNAAAEERLLRAIDEVGNQHKAPPMDMGPQRTVKRGGKRALTDEQRKASSDRMKALNAAKKQPAAV